MESNGAFRCEGDLETNGRYSFKSLLLDGEGMDEVGMSRAHQLVLTGDLDVGEDPLYRDDMLGGRESFKSLLLDGENVEEDESEFSPGNQQEGNGNHVQISTFPSVALAEGVGSQEVESFSLENHGFDCVNQHAVEYVEQEMVDIVEMALVQGTKAPPRKRRRGNGSSLAVDGERHESDMSLDHFMDSAVDDPQIGLQRQPSSFMPPLQPLISLPQGQPLRSMPPPKQEEAETVSTQPPSRKKKQGGTSSDVQRLLDSVIARQEMFFTDLLESMERKEAIRERIREEKEERWRAEERAQLGVFNNAMLALTQELLGDSKSGTQSTDNAK